MVVLRARYKYNNVITYFWIRLSDLFKKTINSEIISLYCIKNDDNSDAQTGSEEHSSSSEATMFSANEESPPPRKIGHVSLQWTKRIQLPEAEIK